MRARSWIDTSLLVILGPMELVSRCRVSTMGMSVSIARALASIGVSFSRSSSELQYPRKESRTHASSYIVRLLLVSTGLDFQHGKNGSEINIRLLVVVALVEAVAGFSVSVSEMSAVRALVSFVMSSLTSSHQSKCSRTRRLPYFSS